MRWAVLLRPVEGLLVAHLHRIAGVRQVYLTPEPDGIDTVYVQLDPETSLLPQGAARNLEEILYDEVVRTIQDARVPLDFCGAGLLAPEANTGARPLVPPSPEARA